MSKIIVDEIQTNTTNGNVRIIPNGTGVLEVNGSCTATSFSGSGASLTALPAANLTGTLPAIDGSNLTGLAGGGAYDFISSQILTSTATYIDFNPTGGLSAGVYKIIGKNVYRPVNTKVEIQAYTNGGTSVVSNTWDYSIRNYNHYQPFNSFTNQQTLIIDNHGQDYYFDGVSLSGDTFEIDFSTDNNSWIRGHSHCLGYQTGWVEFIGYLS